MYITYKGRLVVPLMLVQFFSNQIDKGVSSKIFYYDGELYILITTAEDDNRGISTYRKISMYTLPSKTFNPNTEGFLKEVIQEQVLYERYEYFDLLDKLKIKR